LHLDTDDIEGGELTAFLKKNTTFKVLQVLLKLTSLGLICGHFHDWIIVLIDIDCTRKCCLYLDSGSKFQSAIPMIQNTHTIEEGFTDCSSGSTFDSYLI
jgi:hypothetical protein